MKKKISKVENTELVEIDMTDEMFINLALDAHNKDMKFNDYVNELLRDYLKRPEIIEMLKKEKK